MNCEYIVYTLIQEQIVLMLYTCILYCGTPTASSKNDDDLKVYSMVPQHF